MIEVRITDRDEPACLLLAFGPPCPPESPPVETRAVPLDMVQPYKLRATHRGREIAVDGEPVVTFGDDTLFRWTPDGPGALSGRFEPLGPLGSTEVTVAVDARAGDETKFLQRVFTLEAVPPEADALEDEFGEQVPGPEAPAESQPA